MPKKLKLIGKNVIGIDECNNAFHLNREFGVNFPLLTCGYLIKNYRGSMYHQTPYSGKGKTFTHGKNSHSAKEVLRRARKFFQINPDFFYTLLFKKDLKRERYKLKRAQAIAAISLKFFLKHQLLEEKTIIIADRMDMRDFSEDIAFYTREILSMADIDVPVKIQSDADKKNQAVKKADRIAYWLAGIKFKHDSKRWPKKDRKIDLRNLMDSVLEVKNRGILHDPLDELVQNI